MSSFTDDLDTDDDDLEPEDDAPNESKLVKTLRQQLKEKSARAKQADDYEAQLATYKRQEAIKDAGLTDLSDRRRKALEAAHDGEWTAEGLRATAVDLGWAEPPPPEVPNDEFAAHDRMAAAANGTPSAPRRDEEIDARLAKARTEAEFDAIYRESGRPLAAAGEVSGTPPSHP